MISFLLHDLLTVSEFPSITIRRKNQQVDAIEESWIVRAQNDQYNAPLHGNGLLTVAEGVRQNSIAWVTFKSFDIRKNRITAKNLLINLLFANLT